MANCVIHGGSKEAAKIFGKSYCQKCKDDIAAAVKRVDKHVEPKACFVIYEGKKGWNPIGGTGCAHYVMHQLGKSSGSSNTCLDGYKFRVKEVVSGFKEIAIEDVRVGDIYVVPDKTHMGLVAKVTKGKKDGDPPIIIIMHDSSAQGKVAENDFASRFKSKGTFMR